MNREGTKGAKGMGGEGGDGAVGDELEVRMEKRKGERSLLNDLSVQ